jgi:plastocyanin
MEEDADRGMPTHIRIFFMKRQFQVAGQSVLLLGATALLAATWSPDGHRAHATDAPRTSTGPAAESSAEPSPASASESQVAIDNFTFSPRELTVKVGTRVTWVNHDDVPHTATSNSKPKVFDSRTLDTDQSFSFVFDKPGEYPYFCAVHRHMTGKIIVH